ncbi:MAG: hypothetical protein M1839_005615 [Geoglossum umbratile]|nr:MAG: hypothetical protein M1839_005615 [Geoglossum umbratile]
MAADCERAFSLAKLTLSTWRISILPAILKHLQCLKNWLRLGASSLGTALLQPLEIAIKLMGHTTPPETYGLAGNGKAGSGKARQATGHKIHRNGITSVKLN